MSLQIYTYNDLRSLINESVALYQAAITAGSTEMNALVRSSQDLLGAAPAAEAWLAFVGDASSIVVDGMTEMLVVSLRYLFSQVSPLYLL